FLGHGKRLICDNDGNLLLLFVDAGFVTWNEKRQEFSPDYNFISVPDTWMIVDIIQQPGTKRYWIGTHTGMAVYNCQTKQLSYSRHNEEKIPFVDSKLDTIPMPRGFLMDSKDRLWFFSWGMLTSHGWDVGGPLIYSYDLKKNEALLDTL